MDMARKPVTPGFSPEDTDAGAGSFVQVDVDGAATEKPARESRSSSPTPPPFKPSRDFLLAFGSLMVVILVIAIDATSLSVALPIVSADLNGSALEAFWSGTSFLLSSTVLQPTFASLSHIFGRKYLLYVTGLFFFIGSLVAAVANNFTVILIGRTIQGCGGGGIIALVEVVVTDLVPLSQRGQWFSMISAMWSIGTVTGPLIGAGFSQNIDWRWIFWINLPAIAVGMIAVFFFLHQTSIPGGMVEKLKRFDYIGSVLFTVSSTAFLFGLTSGGVQYGWDHVAVLLPMIGGAALLVVFGWYEFKVAKEPIIERAIFNNWAMVANYIVSIFHGMILWSLLYFLVLYYQAVQGQSVVISAVSILPETLTVAPAGVIVGVVAGITLRYRWSLFSGWIITTLGCGLLLLLGPETTVVQYIFLNIPVGIGTGMLFPAMTLSIQAACKPSLNGHAAAFFSFCRAFGQAIGVALSGVIFQNGFKKELEKIPRFAALADTYSKDATAIVEAIKAMPASEDKTLLIEAYNEALKYIWYALLALSAVSMFIAFTVKSYSLVQDHVTKQGLADKEQRKSKRVNGTSDEENGGAGAMVSE
ncbi:major facilitator superfamily transporter [Zalerion maritima]|uniref:Major facilitator superfamily transporter n=1 Tax=Zalerion maritima TaxID=339359 RepID=A0AAD5RGV4_9PEZI|nr:major facilitator superfamily transporter [Zalerion maritima]